MSEQTAQALDAETRPVMTGPLEGLRLLVVDDEADARELVSLLLENAGAVTIDAASVPEALEASERFRPDVIVTDIGMPGEDGYDFIQRLRASGNHCPMLALTAYARAEDRRRALNAGFQMHAKKPIEPERLLAVVAELAGRGPSSPSAR
jgi:CheY-like chemotaxis protein